MEVKIYYRIWKCGKNLSQMSLCAVVKSSESFWSLKNINLGDQFLSLTFFYTYILSILKRNIFLKLCCCNSDVRKKYGKCNFINFVAEYYCLHYNITVFFFQWKEITIFFTLYRIIRFLELACLLFGNFLEPFGTFGKWWENWNLNLVKFRLNVT